MQQKFKYNCYRSGFSQGSGTTMSLGTRIYFRTWILTIIRGAGKWSPAVWRKRRSPVKEPGQTGINQPLCDHPSLGSITHRKPLGGKRPAFHFWLISRKLPLWLTFNQSKTRKEILWNVVSSLTSLMIEKQTHLSIWIHFFNCSKFSICKCKLMLCQQNPNHIMGLFIAYKTFYS